MEAIEIPVVRQPTDCSVTVPGSKSVTNRALLVAALASGRSVLNNALFSEDTHWFATCLSRLGIEVTSDPERSRFEVVGKGGSLPCRDAELFVGNAGTAARFVTALLTLGKGSYRVDGVPRMRERPMADLLAILAERGAELRFEQRQGCMPFTVVSQGYQGGHVSLRAKQTSQQLSALMMIAPYGRRETTITLPDEPVSWPYVEMTSHVMSHFGVHVAQLDEMSIRIDAGQQYQAREYSVEPDASNASYFFAAAAVTGGRVRVQGLSKHSIQGDIRFVETLESMGCAVTATDSFIEVIGPTRLHGTAADLQNMSDMVQTLAAIAPFADSPVEIRNVEHIRWKETERIQAVVCELRRLGARVDELADGMKIYPSDLHSTAIETYDDHRMAMAFAVTGLRVPGITIKNPECTAKTFPDFFDRFLRVIR